MTIIVQKLTIFLDLIVISFFKCTFYLMQFSQHLQPRRRRTDFRRENTWQNDGGILGKELSLSR